MIIHMDIDVNETEKLLDLIVALKTRMEEYNAPPIPVVETKRCETCKYKNTCITEFPCNKCGIREGKYNFWFPLTPCQAKGDK